MQRPKLSDFLITSPKSQGLPSGVSSPKSKKHSPLRLNSTSHRRGQGSFHFSKRSSPTSKKLILHGQHISKDQEVSKSSLASKKEREIMIDLPQPQSSFEFRPSVQMSNQRSVQQSQEHSPDPEYEYLAHILPESVFGGAAGTKQLQMPRKLKALYERHRPQRSEVLDTAGHGFFPSSRPQKRISNAAVNLSRDLNDSYDMAGFHSLVEPELPRLSERHYSIEQERTKKAGRPKIQEEPKRARLLLPNTTAREKISLTSLQQKNLARSFIEDFNREAPSFRSPIIHLEDFLSRVKSQHQIVTDPLMFSSTMVMGSIQLLSQTMPSAKNVFITLRDLLQEVLFSNSEYLKRRREKVTQGMIQESYVEGISYYQEMRNLEERYFRLQQKMQKWKVQRLRKGNLTKMLKRIAINYYFKNSALKKFVFHGWKEQSARTSEIYNGEIAAALKLKEKRTKSQIFGAILRETRDVSPYYAQCIKAKLGQEKGQKKEVIENCEKQINAVNLKVREQQYEINRLKNRLKKYEIEGLDIDKKIAHFENITAGLRIQTFKEGSDVALTALFRTGPFTHLMPLRILSNIDLTLLLNPGQNLKTLKGGSVGLFLLRWARYSALKQLSLMLGEKANRQRLQSEPIPDTLQIIESLEKIEVKTTQSDLKQITNHSNSSIAQQEESLASLKLEIQNSSIDSISPQVLLLTLMYFNPEKIIEQDLISVLQMQGIRQRYTSVLFHAEQILGVGNICSVDDLIENDRSPLYCLLGLLFYLKPSLESEGFVAQDIMKQSQNIVSAIMTELKYCLRPLIKSLKVPDLNHFVTDLIQIEQISIQQLLVQWVNHLLRQYKKLQLGGARVSVISASFLSKIDLPHIESLQELSSKKFEIIYQFLLYLNSNLNAKCIFLNNRLDEMPLICLVDKQAQVPKQEKQINFYQKCKFIVSSVSHISGRRDLLLLQDLLETKSHIHWEKILIALFLKRPLVIPPPTSELKHAFQQLEQVRVIYTQYLRRNDRENYGRLLAQFSKASAQIWKGVGVIQELMKAWKNLKIRMTERSYEIQEKQENSLNKLRSPLKQEQPIVVASWLAEIDPQIASIAARNKELLIAMIQMFATQEAEFTYLDFWALLKSLKIDTFLLKKEEIENFLTSTFYGNNSTEVCFVARGEQKYSGKAGILQFWKFILYICQDLHFSELAIPAQESSLRAVFQYFLEHILLKFNTNFDSIQKVLMSTKNKEFLVKAYPLLTSLFDAYSGDKNVMMEQEFWRFLSDAQIQEDSFLKGMSIDVVNDTLRVAGPLQSTADRDDAISVQDIAEYTESPSGRMLTFYDFIEALFHLAQYAQRLAFSSPLERFVRFIDNIVLPKLKLNIAYYKEPKTYQLSVLKIPKNPLRDLI